MKRGKSLLVVLAVLVAIIATGCGSKQTKLVCTQEANGVDITFNVGFTGNTIKDMDFTYDMDLSSYNDQQIEAVGKQDFCSIVKKSMSQYENAFTDCKQDIANKKLHVAAELDINKIAKNVLETMSTPEATKEELEKSGYSCTIK